MGVRPLASVGVPVRDRKVVFGDLEMYSKYFGSKSGLGRDRCMGGVMRKEPKRWFYKLLGKAGVSKGAQRKPTETNGNQRESTGGSRWQGRNRLQW